MQETEQNKEPEPPEPEKEPKRKGWQQILRRLWCFCRRLPDYYRRSQSALRKSSEAVTKRWRLCRRIAIASVVILVVALTGYWLNHEIATWIGEDTRASILLAEANFARGRYSQAWRIYAQINKTESSVPVFLQERLALTGYLREIKIAISQGLAQKVDELLVTAARVQWHPTSRAIFNAHYRHLQPEIKKLHQYAGHIKQIMQLLEAGQRQQAEKIFQKALRLATVFRTSLQPLRQQMLAGITAGTADMLVIAWNYREKLRLPPQDIYQALRSPGLSLTLRAEKLLHNNNLEVAKILASLLHQPDRQQLAQRYLVFVDAGQVDPEKQKQRVAIALTLDPTFAEAYFQNARLYSWQGNYKEAIANYQKARVSYESRILSAKGWAYFWQRDFLSAVREWQAALVARPDVATAHLGLGIFYFILQNLPQSVYHITKAEKSRLPEATIMRTILQKKREPVRQKIAGLDAPMRSCLQLCHAIQIYQAGDSGSALRIIDQAQKTWQKKRIVPLEMLAYRAIILRKAGNEQAAQQTLQMLTERKEHREAAIFCALLYFRNNNPALSEYLHKLSQPWQNFWQTTRQ